jgi:hypothetical protein
MATPERIDPVKTREKVINGSALLVCAYDDEKKFNAMHLDGAISLSALQSELPSLSKDQEIIFY